MGAVTTATAKQVLCCLGHEVVFVKGGAAFLDLAAAPGFGWTRSYPFVAPLLALLCGCLLVLAFLWLVRQLFGILFGKEGLRKERPTPDPDYRASEPQKGGDAPKKPTNSQVRWRMLDG